MSAMVSMPLRGIKYSIFFHAHNRCKVDCMSHLSNCPIDARHGSEASEPCAGAIALDCATFTTRMHACDAQYE